MYTRTWTQIWTLILPLTHALKPTPTMNLPDVPSVWSCRALRPNTHSRLGSERSVPDGLPVKPQGFRTPEQHQGTRAATQKKTVPFRTQLSELEKSEGKAGPIPENPHFHRSPEHKL